MERHHGQRAVDGVVPTCRRRELPREPREPGEPGELNGDGQTKDARYHMVNNTDCIEAMPSTPKMSSSRYSVFLTEYRESHLDAPSVLELDEAGPGIGCVHASPPPFRGVSRQEEGTCQTPRVHRDPERLLSIAVWG